MSCGVLQSSEETAVALLGNWLHTGDMGKKDEDGYIFIVDRRKEMLLVRGMNVYPREIEEVLHQFPNVREAAVVPKLDEKRGEVPIAFVCPVEERSSIRAKSCVSAGRDSPTTRFRAKFACRSPTTHSHREDRQAGAEEAGVNHS